MRPHVTLLGPDGRAHHLGHGDLIGRRWTAALLLDDARVSEAHAMVSLRGDTLKLLGLRGRCAVNGQPLSELELAPGQRIALARDLEITVSDVILPDRVLAMEAPGLGRRVLTGASSLLAGPPPSLVPGRTRDAVAWLWSTGDN